MTKALWGPSGRLRCLAGHVVAPNLTAAEEQASNLQIVIAKAPKGPLVADEHFIARRAPKPQLGSKPGMVLVETLAITMGAGQRAGLQGSATYVGATSGATDTVMSGSGVGRILESSHEKLRPGALVMGGTGWQRYSLLPGAGLTELPATADPALHLGALGTNGLTAYFGLLDIGQPKAGDTVVVSGAGGSVGHLVGQIAKIKGARVVGIAGSDDKCRRLVEELGFDRAINYKSANFRAELKEATPKRINVYFDNTGGPILESVLFRMATFGRIACCGNVSQYDTASPGGGPRGIPGLLVNNQVKMQGFVVFSYAKRYPEAIRDLSAWVADGRLKCWTTVYDGLERAPSAFVDLLHGVTQGTTIVRVAA